MYASTPKANKRDGKVIWEKGGEVTKKVYKNLFVEFSTGLSRV
jgi:hypothetical protein